MGLADWLRAEVPGEYENLQTSGEKCCDVIKGVGLEELGLPDWLQCEHNIRLPVRCHVNVIRMECDTCHAINMKYVEKRWDDAGDNDKNGEGLFNDVATFVQITVVWTITYPGDLFCVFIISLFKLCIVQRTVVVCRDFESSTMLPSCSSSCSFLFSSPALLFLFQSCSCSVCDSQFGSPIGEILQSPSSTLSSARSRHPSVCRVLRIRSRVKKKVVESENFKILWEFTIQCDRKIEARRPDIVFIDKKKREVVMLLSQVMTG